MSDVLADFANEFLCCWICGRSAIRAPFGRLEIHHIARGVHLEGSRHARAGLIRTCVQCHEKHLSSMPIAMQLALKRMFDPENYDRVAVNQLRHRAPDAITEDEVDIGELIISGQSKVFRYAHHKATVRRIRKERSTPADRPEDREGRY